MGIDGFIFQYLNLLNKYENFNFAKEFLKRKVFAYAPMADYSIHTSVKFCLLAILKPINDYDGYDYDYDNDYVSD